MTKPRDLVLILDFGSQYTQLIARRIREQRVYSEIHPCTVSFDAIVAMNPRAIILSGGPSSVYGEGAPTMDKRILELGVPILGVCYGLQLIAHLLGGKVEAAKEREYGAAKVVIEKPVGILHRFAQRETIEVWMSHGDRITALPPGFQTIGISANTPFCAVGNIEKKIYGIQFHPEVVHTPRGADVYGAFLFDVAGLAPTFARTDAMASSANEPGVQVGASPATSKRNAPKMSAPRGVWTTSGWNWIP